MGIAAGKMRTKLLIQERTGETDAANQPLDNWVTLFEVWSQPRSATGMAAVRATMQGVPDAPSKVSFRIRYRENITEAMRVVVKRNMVVYDIRDIRFDLENQEWTDLVCETGGNNG